MNRSLNAITTLLALSVAALVAGSTAATASPAGETGRFVLNGRVTRTVDGDTFDVRLTSGKRDRVRIVGIDTPERGACYGSQATARAQALSQGKLVRLVGDATQATRDRFGRLLAYVRLPNGTDLGRALIAGGFAKVFVFNRPFARVVSYRAAERAAQAAGRGLWSACQPQTTADLALTLLDAPDPVTGGSELTYTATVGNVGPGAAADVRLTIGFDPGVLGILAATPTQGTCSQGAPVVTAAVTCALGPIAAGSSATVSIIVGAMATLTATATVTSPNPDPNRANNSAWALTTVVGGTAPSASGKLPPQLPGRMHPAAPARP
jgi:endonuclease YncB( thermonuclease family)